MNNKYVAALGLFVTGLTMSAASCGDKPAEKNKNAKTVDTVEKDKSKSTTQEKPTVSEKVVVKKETLPSGLAFAMITAAKEGAKAPVKGSKVAVHYTGWLDQKGEPGNKFDSSVDRGFPFKFSVGIGQVIAGWDEGVLLMKVGEKRRFFIPSKLGYGAYGAGAAIPPHADLIFDVEMLDVA